MKLYELEFTETIVHKHQVAIELPNNINIDDALDIVEAGMDTFKSHEDYVQELRRKFDAVIVYDKEDEVGTMTDLECENYTERGEV